MDYFGYCLNHYDGVIKMEIDYKAEYENKVKWQKINNWTAVIGLSIALIIITIGIIIKLRS